MTPEAQQSRTPYESSTPDATRVVHEDDFIDPDDLSDPEYQLVGREQLMALLEHGMTDDSYVLDIGCGKLRGGRLIIPLLQPGHYCGIEPVKKRVDIGLATSLEPEMVALKRPRFDHNTDFDFSVFGVKFTHFVARSIWSHASKEQIEKMLDGVRDWGQPGAVMLASFRATGPNRRNDYQGEEWKGRSHESTEHGIVAHSVRWVDEACSERGLVFEISTRPPVKKNGQVWAVVTKPRRDQDPEELHRLRASRAARQLKHNLRNLKFAATEIMDALDVSEDDQDLPPEKLREPRSERSARRLKDRLKKIVPGGGREDD